jgi:hypothetical protein
MNSRIVLLFVLSCSLALLGCVVEKRIHTSGYYLKKRIFNSSYCKTFPESIKVEKIVESECAIKSPKFSDTNTSTSAQEFVANQNPIMKCDSQLNHISYTLQNNYNLSPRFGMNRVEINVRKNQYEVVKKQGSYFPGKIILIVSLILAIVGLLILLFSTVATWLLAGRILLFAALGGVSVFIVIYVIIGLAFVWLLASL